MRNRIILTIAIGLLALPGAVPTAHAQGVDERAAIERLERMRLERLREALDLNPEQSADLEVAMRDFRRQSREVGETQRQATQRLRQALRRDPVDQSEVRDALEAVEATQRANQELRRRQRDRLESVLNAEQQAKFLLFNRQFDARVRQLIAERRAQQDRLRDRRIRPRDRDHDRPRDRPTDRVRPDAPQRDQPTDARRR